MGRHYNSKSKDNCDEKKDSTADGVAERMQKPQRQGKAGRNTQSIKSNDPSWYYPSEQILRDVASIPFSHMAGTKVKLGNENTASNYSVYIPGLLTIELQPTMGNSEDQTSAINSAAFQLYSWVRHANSGHANYDAPDMMLYIMAMSQAYSFINFAQRLYGCAMLYSNMNRYLPKLLIEAQQVDFDDLQSNLANFRAWLNMLITKTASFSVPSQIKLFLRHSFLYQNIYIEGTSIRDQLYMYVPFGFMQYQLNTDGSGMLKTVPWKRSDGNANKYTVNEIIAYGNALLQPLFDSEDIGIMSGDIMKAYGGDVIKLSLIPESYIIAPIMDIRVLEQMKNATCLGDVTYTLTQNPTHAYLIGKAEVTNLTAEPNPGSHLLNAYKDIYMNYASENRLLTTTTADVGPDLVIENTRLMTNGVWSDTDNTFVVTAFGSEIARYMHIWKYQTSSDGVISTHSALQSYICFHEYGASKTGNDYNGISQNDMDRLGTWFDTLNSASHFDFHPFIHSFLSMMVDNATPGVGSSRNRPIGICYDLDNYTVVHADELERLHSAAMLGLLQSPSFNIA